MTLSYQLDQDGFNGLDETTQKLYTQSDDGNYILNITGMPTEDVEGLRKKRDELMNETKAEKEKRKQLEARLAELEQDKQNKADDEARAKGDIEALQKSWQSKLDKTQSEHKTQIDNLNKRIYDMTVGQTALQMATELAVQGSANVLLPHIKSRLSLTNKDDGTHQIQVLDEQGNISALTLDELKADFKNNPAFKPLIAGVSATGSGATGAGTKAPTQLKRSQMTPKDVSEYIAKHGREAYLKLAK